MAARETSATTFGASVPSAVIPSPPYEWPATIIGPVRRFNTWRRRATSAASEVSGNWGAVTMNPDACNNRITSLQLEPSAHAPWTSTTFGLLLMVTIVRAELAASHESTDSFLNRPPCLQARRAVGRARLSPAWEMFDKGGHRSFVATGRGVPRSGGSTDLRRRAERSAAPAPSGDHGDQAHAARPSPRLPAAPGARARSRRLHQGHRRASRFPSAATAIRHCAAAVATSDQARTMSWLEGTDSRPGPEPTPRRTKAPPDRPRPVAAWRMPGSGRESAALNVWRLLPGPRSLR